MEHWTLFSYPHIHISYIPMIQNVVKCAGSHEIYKHTKLVQYKNTVFHAQ